VQKILAEKKSGEMKTRKPQGGRESWPKGGSVPASKLFPDPKRPGEEHKI
jgi:hypothetical protein